MNVTVIGGAGQMGRWLVRYFFSRGHRLTISDTNVNQAKTVAEEMKVEFAKNNVEAVKTADLIVVSTPIQTIPEVITQIVPHVRNGAILAEISSLKARTVKTLAKITTLNVTPLSIHPLFGPGAKSLKGLKIVVIPILNSAAETELVKTLFPEANITVVNVEEHDRAMALTLSLPHFMNLVFASTLVKENLTMLKNLAGPTFKLQLTLAESVMIEKPALQASIQINNKYFSQYLRKYLSTAKTIEQWIVDQDEEKVKAFCTKIRSSLSKDLDFTESYERMYTILENL